MFWMERRSGAIILLPDGLVFSMEGIFESQGTHGTEQKYFPRIFRRGGRDGGSGLWIVRCLVPGYVLVEPQNIILVYSTHRSICGVAQRSRQAVRKREKIGM